MYTATLEIPRIASINGIALHTEGEVLSQQELRQRCCSRPMATGLCQLSQRLQLVTVPHA